MELKNKPISKTEIQKMENGVFYKTKYPNRRQRRMFDRTNPFPKSNNRKQTIGRLIQKMTVVGIKPIRTIFFTNQRQLS